MRESTEKLDVIIERESFFTLKSNYTLRLVEHPYRRYFWSSGMK